MNPVMLTLTLALLPPVHTPNALTPPPRTLREAGQAAATAAATAQPPATACVAQAREWIEECEAEEAERRAKNKNGLPDRTGLGWTGLGLASAGVVQLGIGYNVSRWRRCGPANVNHCHNLERVYRLSGGTLLATGLTFFIVDETRRYRNRAPAPATARRTVIDIGPRAVQVRLLF